MNTNNLQQWWEDTFRHHQAKQGVFDPSELQMLPPSSLQPQPFASGGFGESGSRTSASEHGESFGLGNFTLASNPYDADVFEDKLSSSSMVLLTISYGLVIFGGVLGNLTLMLTLCSASSVRLRNPLLLAVCLADLLVTGISAPLTFLNMAMSRTKSLPLAICKVLHYVQVMPVAASTISFFMLSLDRFATVKHPRLAQLRQRRYLHLTLALVSWLSSAAISAPFLFAYKIIAKTVIIRAPPLPTASPHAHPAAAAAEPVSPNVSISCTSDLGANANVFVSFIIFHTIAVFVIPGFGVLLNHYGVRRKLCALSLTARAAHGELPLPMPILRRQTHMVIVTGIANVQQAGCDGAGTTVDDTSNGAGDIQLHNLNPQSAVPRHNVIKSSNPISPRAMREIRAHSQRQRVRNQVARGPATPGIPLPQTSTLRSRRRLANMLIGSAVIFILCWAPHVFCIFYNNFGYKQYCTKTATNLNLLLGYMYSAFSPVIYWALNHNTLRQSPCAPIIRLRSVQNFLRTHFRSNTVPPPPSSTNEAALGAFNPKLIKLTPKQYRAQASSHYLY